MNILKQSKDFVSDCTISLLWMRYVVTITILCWV